MVIGPSLEWMARKGLLEGTFSNDWKDRKEVFGRVWGKCALGRQRKATSEDGQTAACTGVFLLTKPWTLVQGRLCPEEGVCALQDGRQKPLDKPLVREDQRQIFGLWRRGPFQVEWIHLYCGLGRADWGVRSSCRCCGKPSNAGRREVGETRVQGYNKGHLY